MATILLAYSTVDGHTLTICRRLQQQLERHGHAVSLQPIDEQQAPDPAAYDTIVVGASIRYGRHRPAVHRFVERHRAILARKPTAFFSVNVVARKPGKNRPDTNPYVRKFLHQTGWRPTLPDVFAGRIDYRRYRFTDRLLIRFIMWLTNGPTHADAAVEFTDWDRVDAFGMKVAALQGNL
jgi:menaquinone-dependent protoporphyrinogen oxidase